MTEKEFLSIVNFWIYNSPHYTELAKNLKATGLNPNTKLSVENSSIEVIKKVSEDEEWMAIKHNNLYLEQEWETYIIFHRADIHTASTTSEVVINITCLGDISHTTSFPFQRLEVIRVFAGATQHKVLFDPIFSGSDYKVAEEKDKDFLLDVINGKVHPVLPVVYVTKFRDSAGYAVDMNTLAKRLEGIAYVVCEPDDGYSDYLNNRVEDTRRKLHGSGAVNIYFGGSKVIFPSNKFSSVDGFVMQYVLQAVTSYTNKTYVTPVKFNREILAEHEALLDEYSIENISLEEKLKEAEAQIASLTAKNKSLTELNEQLKASIASTGKQQILDKTELVEFYEAEQYDAVVNALNIALKSMGENTRHYEIIKNILDSNKPRNHGIVIFEEVKKLFSSGVNLNKADMARLEALGFEIVGENNHRKLIFKGNDKYMFPMAITGSDNKRGGLNFASDIIRNLTIY
ncbi:MAG: hypothetical protein UGF89_09980 [Acutalibacteraceae bacterium]|nr:hypothetical protein [Acutalibacteraceae bacterium]